jgi:hypothetical protein
VDCVLWVLTRAGFKRGRRGGRPGASTKRGLHKIQVFLGRKASRKSSPETDHVTGNLLRVEAGGCRRPPGDARRGGGCIYVFLLIIRNKNKNCQNRFPKFFF